MRQPRPAASAPYCSLGLCASVFHSLIFGSATREMDGWTSPDAPGVGSRAAAWAYRGLMTDSSHRSNKPVFKFIDAEKPPPGVDLSRWPPDVDINELMAQAYISDGELGLTRELEAEGGEMTEEELRKVGAMTAELAQMVIDDYLLDPSDPD